ncbi:hypothetical protein FRC07_003722 [Ceratobasidium sp. 392]|nr:hypothetical protein FRC07_003722 [Ceratobasidium sp. 392]
MPSTTASSPTARRVTSPPPSSPPAKAAATTATTGATSPERRRSNAPSSPPKEPRASERRASEPEEKIPEPTETLDIDETVFSQITEMDDDDPDCEFSREIVVDYFKQAATTFEELRQALEKEDLATLSAKGHFLKGSSAALGVKKVQESCEHVQHYGAKRDEIAGIDLTAAQALRRVALMMPRLERDYALAEKWLRNYYLEKGIDLEGDEEDE